MNRKIVYILVFVALILVGCDKDLSRSEAERLIIEETKGFLDTGVIVDTGVMPSLYGYEWVEKSVLVGQDKDKNKAIIVGEINVDDGKIKLSSNESTFSSRNMLVLHQTNTPIDFKIVVTGVAQANNNEAERNVDFTWTQNSIPVIIKALAHISGGGTVRFQRYDDGWRVISIVIDLSDIAANISTEELAELETIKEKESLRKSAEFAEVEARYKEATKETDVLADFGSLIVMENSMKYRTNPSADEVSVLYSDVSQFGIFRGGWGMYLQITPFCWGTRPSSMPNHSYNIPPNKNWDLNEVVRTLNKALDNWKKSHSEFYGTDWQVKHYGSVCGRR